ncbi:putative bifunctional diguanylate cyclase/phosphodiesterase [Sphingomonas sp. 10B4]|jgi:diguanylate cyclase (GGDEF)-like protein|uniref:putative bifunctional diguanylate cyclase/phosphodiesterase n=1 Tax=unclassified Sphingomonas TaxID=196159 RepID=UPI002AB3B869|nr:EAL domain-containing protein [Sphingomonas sp. 10B4]MDY7522521.1 EAL domain-containing protein [Sphingomonas sp. 10B4]MEB0282339.1 EAL domain-containing protein [Sphingomonas sp. 10B4]
MTVEIRGEPSDAGSSAPPKRREILNGAITVASILLFVGTGSSVLSTTVRRYFYGGEGPDQTLVIALLLNVALILFGWRRHRELAHEVTIRTAAEERAQMLAAKDPLTGFLNRRSLAEEGAAMFVRAQARNKAMALLMLDLDHFKMVNDMHGHATGDALLQQVALQIAEAMPSVALTARFGGDEFACAFLFDAAHPATVERIAEKLVSQLAQPFRIEGLQLHISVSVGISRSDFDCASIDALMRSADIAMYAAKNSGRNRFAWFDLSMERELQARNELEVGLRNAIPRQEIVPYFEQQIDLTTGRLSGFEVLARWEHATRGLIVPDTFIPIAEETGMIADLSLSLMRQAFLAAKDWDAALSLSVNISPSQLRDAWLAQKIIKVLTETGFPASRLEIEITETALFDNLPLAQSIVGSLKNQGIRLALDDFGTGYSSLAHLRALPFDRIKIDKSFIMSMTENTESAAIVTAITRLGDSLNLPITAEGIEDLAVEERLRGLGCGKGQGYLYGRPTSIANTRRLLAERRLLQNAASEAGEPDERRAG